MNFQVSSPRATPITPRNITYAQPNMVQAPVSPANLNQNPLYLSATPLYLNQPPALYLNGSPRYNLQNEHNNTSVLSILGTPIKSEFGMISCVQILSFRNAELEKIAGNKLTVEAIGVLHVLYFAEYDKFALSLNNWKYALFKRIHVAGTDPNIPGPTKYRLPASDGFYILAVDRENNFHAVKNLETILRETTKFSNSGHGNGNAWGNSALTCNPKLPGRKGSANQKESIAMGSSYADSLTGAERLKRGFKKMGSTLSMTQNNPNNLNHSHTRDFETMKKTTPVMASAQSFPKKEVERWVLYNQEVCNIHNFEPEDLNTSSYSNLINENQRKNSLNEGALIQSIGPHSGITTERSPPVYNAPTTIGNNGRNFTTGGYHTQISSEKPKLETQNTQNYNNETRYVDLENSQNPILQQNSVYNNSQILPPETIHPQHQPRNMSFGQSTIGLFERIQEADDFSSIDAVAEEGFDSRNEIYPSIVNRISSSLSSRGSSNVEFQISDEAPFGL